MPVRDGPSCPGCGLANYEGLCPVCSGDEATARHEGMPFPWAPATTNEEAATNVASTQEQTESRQIYAAICECNAVLASGPATVVDVLDRLNCRECGASVPCHRVTLPYRGYGVDQVRKCVVCGGDVEQSISVLVPIREVPGGTDYGRAHRGCAHPDSDAKVAQ